MQLTACACTYDLAVFSLPKFLQKHSQTLYRGWRTLQPWHFVFCRGWDYFFFFSPIFSARFASSSFFFLFPLLIKPSPVFCLSCVWKSFRIVHVPGAQLCAKVHASARKVYHSWLTWRIWKITGWGVCVWQLKDIVDCPCGRSLLLLRKKHKT